MRLINIFSKKFENKYNIRRQDNKQDAAIRWGSHVAMVLHGAKEVDNDMAMAASCFL